MRPNKLFRVLFLFAILTVGVWLLVRPGSLQPEGLARLQALNGLSAGGSTRATVQGDVQTGRSVVHSAVTPAVVDFTAVVVSTESTDGMYARWLRGELDLDENDSIAGEAEMARMIEAALAQPPDDNVQQAQSVHQAGDGPRPAAPSPGVSFDAIDFTASSGFVPPDPELAVGPDHMIAVVNAAVAIYDKTGATLFGPTVAGNLFSQSDCQSGLYDPNVLYDEEADRWILAYDKGFFDPDGGYCLLASQSGDPTGSWYEYFFQLNDDTVWLDYPHAAVGDTHIFMGGNMFTHSDGGTYSESRLFAFDKSNLYAGAAVSVVQRGMGALGSTPQPLNLHGYGAGAWPDYGNEHYFLTDPYDGLKYYLWRWNPVTDYRAFVGAVELGSTDQPIDVPQDGTGLIQANDWRPLDFEYRNGFGWVTMTVSCNPGNGAVNCVRWAQVDLTNADLGPAGTGTYGSNGEHRFFPDLAVNQCNDMVVGYTRSSSSSYPAIWVTGREHGDFGGTLQAETQLKAGEIAYTAFDGSPRRWGDYTGMTIDPDGQTFWYLGEYSKDTGTSVGRWGTYIGSFTYPDCASPAGDPQIVVDPGALNVTQAADAATAHTLSITNTGSASLDWTIEEASHLTGCNAPDDISWLSVSSAAGSTAAGDSSPLDVTFDAAGLTAGVYTGTLCIDSNDPLTPRLEAPLQLTVESVVYGLSLSGNQAASGLAGQTVTYTLQITNTGDVADTFDFDVSGNVWSTTLAEDNLALNAGVSTVVEFYVVVPGDATDGDTDTALIIATSQGDAGESDSVTLETTATTSPPTYGVTLTPDQTASGLAGQMVTYTLQMTNTGGAADTYDLSLSGNAWNTTLARHSVALNAGESATVEVTVDVPGDATDGDTDTALIGATSREDASVSDSAELETTATTPVEPYHVYVPLIIRP